MMVGGGGGGRRQKTAQTQQEAGGSSRDEGGAVQMELAAEFEALDLRAEEAGVDGMRRQADGSRPPVVFRDEQWTIEEDVCRPEYGAHALVAYANVQRTGGGGPLRCIRDLRLRHVIPLVGLMMTVRQLLRARLPDLRMYAAYRPRVYQLHFFIHDRRVPDDPGCAVHHHLIELLVTLMTAPRQLETGALRAEVPRRESRLAAAVRGRVMSCSERLEGVLTAEAAGRDSRERLVRRGDSDSSLVQSVSSSMDSEPRQGDGAGSAGI